MTLLWQILTGAHAGILCGMLLVLRDRPSLAILIARLQSNALSFVKETFNWSRYPGDRSAIHPDNFGIQSD
jgi:hypothetical protein